LTWRGLILYAGKYSISIEKLRRGQNDATRARAAAAGRAVGVEGRRRACRAGTKWERFYYFLFNARDPISAEALQLLSNKCFNCVGAPSPPDFWLTREVLYIAPSGFDSSGDRRQQLAAYNASRPMACAHKTVGEWSRSSSARVKTCDHVFGGTVFNYSLLHDCLSYGPP
jgi:hypothetical protein